ncbi:MAG: hypothetical protein ABIJ50_14095 [Pseudomonadota bacterium]
MSRKPRIHLPGGLYHVLFRGNGGQNVFLTDADYCRFYLLLQEGTFRFGYRVRAFCLMTNYIHLVLQVDEIPLSSASVLKTKSQQRIVSEARAVAGSHARDSGCVTLSDIARDL